MWLPSPQECNFQFASHHFSVVPDERLIFGTIRGRERGKKDCRVFIVPLNSTAEENDRRRSRSGANSVRQVWQSGPFCEHIIHLSFFSGARIIVEKWNGCRHQQRKERVINYNRAVIDKIARSIIFLYFFSPTRRSASRPLCTKYGYVKKSRRIGCLIPRCTGFGKRMTNRKWIRGQHWAALASDAQCCPLFYFQ